MVSWPTHRHRRPALDPAGGAPQRYRGEHEPPTAQRRATKPRWPPAREPCQALDPRARQRAQRGGGILCPLCRSRVDAVRPSNAGGGQGGPWRRPWRYGAEAPRGGEGARAAPGGARAPPSHRAWSRGSPHRPGRVAEPVDSRGGQGRLAGGRRVRGDGAAGPTERAGLGLRVPSSQAHDGDVGGRDCAPRCVRRGSPGGETAGRHRGLWHTRGVWPHHGAVLLGQEVARAPVSGQHEGHRRGGVSLVAHAMPPRDLFLSPAQPRFP